MAEQNISFVLDEKLQKIVSPDATKYLLQQWSIKMFPYIPFVTGTLASTYDIEQRMSPDEAMVAGLENIEQSIHFKAPYASNMYYGEGFNFTRDQHPQAQARWAEVARDLHGEELSKAFVEYITRKEILK